MCRYTIHLVRYSLVLILSLSVWSATSLANVCSDGIALPPFLDAGADPNLLLVLDNSGSMLDAAYIDDTTQCVDTLFLKVRDEVDPTVINDDLSLIYAGNFERTDEAGDPIWYRWVPNPDGIEEWQTGECYGDGELLYAEGGFYQASCSLDSYNCPTDTDAPTVIDGCRESRSFFSERLSEANVYWESPAAPEWDASEPYVLGTGSATTFVKYDGLFYKLITANPPPSPPPADINPAIIGVQSHWELVDHTWQAGVSYPTDKIVSYNGMFYEQTVTSTSEEPGKLGNDDWKRLDEGFFAQVGSTIEQGSSTVTVQSCSTPTHSSSNSNDLRIEFLFDGSGTDVEDAIGVSCFEATGNLLNWAASSKFDIQKKILTGGKYFSGADPDEDGRLVMESRGCATKGFVKEIDLTDGATLTFRIAGPQKEQTIVSDDFRTRIDILAVTDSGGFNREYCDEVLRILSNPEYYDNNGDLEAKWKGELQDNTFGCLHGTTDPSEVEPPVANTEMHEFNRSVMDCWQIARGQKPSASGTLKTHCEKIYDGSDEPTTPQQYPWNIGPYDPWHICSGEYDPSGLTKGTGYVGRCWAESASSGGVDPDCNPLTCSESGTVLGQALGEGQYWHDSNWSNYWCDGGNILKCTNKKLVDCADADYSVYLTDTNGDECGGGPDPATRLCDDWDDDGSDDDLACWTDWELTGDGSEGLQSYIAAPVVPHEFNETGGGTDRCVEYAEWDYCQSLSLDEIIDPSDQVFETGETFNIPASLIDAAVYQQLNVDVPLLSMAGYVKYDLPAVQISPGGEPAERPEGPRGVIYDVANDIRIGVMAFNDNGAATECAADDAGGNIVKHCPDGNRDGAKVIAKVDIGMSFDSSSLEDWDHYEDIIQAINDTQATSWTPLAEAVFNAIGYYGQNDEFRLDPEDFMTAAEAALVTPSDEELIDKWADPVQYWCQENHILIISEGASTADINPLVDTFVTANAEGLVFDDATDSGTDSTCADGLDGSTFLDDMTWFGQNATVTGNAANDSNLYDELLPKYPEDPTNTEHEKSTITTHIITTGTLRGELNGNECEPIEVMTQAADNGAAPTGLMTGEDPDQLEDNLRAVLQSILNRASAGSAASVISSSRSGEGAAYQAVFWPEIPRDNDDDPLVWTGDVHAMFIDELGQLWDDYSSGSGGNGYLYSEDTNGNGVIDPGEGTAPVTCLDGDRRIFYYYNATENRTEICFNTSGQETGTCDPAQTVYCGAPFGEPYTIREFQDYVWSAKDELTGIADGDVIINRAVNPPTAAAGLHPSTPGLWSWDGVTKRYLFTWNDLSEDGIVDTDEIISLEASGNTSIDNWDFNYTAGLHSILDDFGIAPNTDVLVRDAEMNSLVNWLRGQEQYETATIDLNGDGVYAEDYIYRCRKLGDCYIDPNDPSSGPSSSPVWRLGDIIHSTPKLVAQPVEAFHTIYRDPSYAYFVKRHRYRRNMIYFGANDGMLHAVNGGFYEPDASSFYENMDLENDGSRCYYNNNSPVDTASEDPTIACIPTGAKLAPPLGSEMWAYVPYNLQPHLSCLTDFEYAEGHKYFVDKEPRIFDMQIFKEESICATNPYDKDCIHPKGWGTILVGAMRFGGAPQISTDGSGREFISSYFILDITDPERPPTLLAEMTRTSGNQCVDDGSGMLVDCADLGFSVPMTAGVVQRDDNGDTLWYLLFGNGPTTIKGENSEQGKIAILPMGGITGFVKDGDSGVRTVARKPFRIPNAPPLTIPDGFVYGNDTSRDAIYNQAGIISVGVKNTAQKDENCEVVLEDDDSNPSTPDVPVTLDISQSFTSDLVTINFDLETLADPVLGGIYESDAVYFGTTDGGGFINKDDGTNCWPYGGRVMRLLTSNIDGSRIPPPGEWQMAPLMTSIGPVTAAPTIGWDSQNFWVYYGTGRFFATEDKTDETTQHFFGVKEPFDNTCELTFKEITWPQTPNPSRAETTDSVERGLARTDYIKVELGGDLIFCEPGHPDFAECDNLSYLAGEAGSAPYSFEDLQRYIVGEYKEFYAGDCSPNTKTTTTGDPPVTTTSNLDIGIEGWYRELTGLRERVVGQPTLLGGLTTFSSYIPFDDACTAEGLSNLYFVHFQTGTAWTEEVYGLTGGYTYGTNTDITTVNDKLFLGRGLATTPSVHLGTGEGHDAKIIIQKSTGEIIEMEQFNLPIKNIGSGKLGWTDQCE